MRPHDRCLAIAFSMQSTRALLLAQRRPALGLPGGVGTRSRRVRRFPYRLVYLEQPEQLWIIAVAHQSRRPDYWLRRVVTP